MVSILRHVLQSSAFKRKIILKEALAILGLIMVSYSSEMTTGLTFLRVGLVLEALVTVSTPLLGLEVFKDPIVLLSYFAPVPALDS